MTSASESPPQSGLNTPLDLDSIAALYDRPERTEADWQALVADLHRRRSAFASAEAAKAAAGKGKRGGAKVEDAE